VEQKQPLLVNDTASDARYFSVDEKIMLSELCVPIMHDNETLGAINTEHSVKDFYTGRHVQILTTIASLCGDKIDEINAEQESRLKEMEVLTLQKDFATSQLTALRMQMNPHFIFNALNSIQHYILQGNVVEANKYLSKFSKLQRDILHCSSQQFITLEKELEILTAYLELEQHRFGKSFSYKINVHDDIEPVEISIPPMILQPFVENAIWHGLMPLQTERMLSIYFDLETDDMLLVTLRDNGIGRSASAGLKNQNGETKTDHQSKGMSMVQERLQLLQQQYGKPFEMSIADITGIAGEVQGTEVTLKIFIGNKKL
jgi:two-component system, LytTR family, sensor kinase